MNGSPLSYPLNRGADVDAGGAADLQTDVMRFMAILSLCLVAIFALVQSLPTTPMSSPPAAAAQSEDRPTPEAPAAVTEPIEPAPEPSVPVRQPLPPAPVYAEPKADDAPQTPVAPASNLAPAPQPAPPAPATPAAPAAPKTGFVLRFASDRALLELAEQGSVALYAITETTTHRLNLNTGAASFWPAATPRQFHQMHKDTVPQKVQRALRQAHAGRAVTWGVTLPASLSNEVARYLREHAGGTLIIGENGKLRMEP